MLTGKSIVFFSEVLIPSCVAQHLYSFNNLKRIHRKKGNISKWANSSPESYSIITIIYVESFNVANFFH